MVPKEEQSGEQRPCRFPFIIGGRRYDSCTDYKDPDGRKWCSTKTSSHELSMHTHVGSRGFWGFCTEDCVQDSTVAGNDPSLGTWKPSGERGECGITAAEAFRSHVIQGVLDKRNIPYEISSVGAAIGGYDASYGQGDTHI